MTALSEAASKKRGRGRPPAFSAEYRAAIGALFPDIKTRRGLSDCLYRLRAVNLLEKDKRFTWLADGEAMQAGRPGAWRPAILTELGRIGDDDTLLAVAARLCELKPKTKDAVARIRRARLGREPAGDYLALCVHLENTVNSYLLTHPAAPWANVTRALRELAECIEAESGTPQDGQGQAFCASSGTTGQEGVRHDGLARRVADAGAAAHQLGRPIARA